MHLVRDINFSNLPVYVIPNLVFTGIRRGIKVLNQVVISACGIIFTQAHPCRKNTPYQFPSSTQVQPIRHLSRERYNAPHRTVLQTSIDTPQTHIMTRDYIQKDLLLQWSWSDDRLALTLIPFTYTIEYPFLIFTRPMAYNINQSLCQNYKTLQLIITKKGSACGFQQGRNGKRGKDSLWGLYLRVRFCAILQTPIVSEYYLCRQRQAATCQGEIH